MVLDRRAQAHPALACRGDVERVVAEIARNPERTSAQPQLAEGDQADAASGVAEAVDVGLADADPAGELDPELERRVGPRTNSAWSRPRPTMRLWICGIVASPTPTVPISSDSISVIDARLPRKRAKVAAAIQPAVPPPAITISRGEELVIETGRTEPGGAATPAGAA